MLKDLIILPDGTELFSGKVGENAIFDSTFTECVNSGEDLTLGSTCANMLEVTIWNPGSRLKINAGDELTLYKVDKTGERHKIGIFLAEKPERPSDNIMRLTCYDRIIKLDVDLTDWLLGITGWPYTLLEFAGMVCEKCGLNFITTEVTNGDFPIYAHTKQGTTGRMLMQWLGEIAASFCRADRNGNVEFGWYEFTNNIVTETGKHSGPFKNAGYYYQGSLSYSDYTVEKMDAVQVKLADMLYPEVDAGKNVYVIADNPFLYAAALYGEAKEPEELPEEPEKVLIGYSYNGRVLQALPKYDASVYHYANIAESKGIYTLYLHDAPLVYNWSLYSDASYTKAKEYKNDGSGWKLYREVPVDGFEYPEGWHANHYVLTPFWTNYDLKDKNGIVKVAKSEPAPAYEEEVEEPEQDETDVLDPSVLKPYIKNILGDVKTTAMYVPCKVTIPAQLTIRAGDTFMIVPRDYQDDISHWIPTRCMIRTQKNQRDTLEATDSQRLDSVSAQYSGSGSGSSASSQISNTALKVVSTGKNVSMSVNGGILTMTHNDEKVLEVKATDTVEAAILALKDALLAATGNLSIYATGDLSIGCNGAFSLGNYAMSWKDNGDGTFTPIGTPKQ